MERQTRARQPGLNPAAATTRAVTSPQPFILLSLSCLVYEVGMLVIFPSSVCWEDEIMYVECLEPCWHVNLQVLLLLLFLP